MLIKWIQSQSSSVLAFLFIISIMVFVLVCRIKTSRNDKIYKFLVAASVIIYGLVASMLVYETKHNLNKRKPDLVNMQIATENESQTTLNHVMELQHNLKESQIELSYIDSNDSIKKIEDIDTPITFSPLDQNLCQYNVGIKDDIKCLHVKITIPKKYHELYGHQKSIKNLAKNRLYDYCTWLGLMYKYSGTYISGNLSDVCIKHEYLTANIMPNDQGYNFYILNVPNKISQMKKYSQQFKNLKHLFSPHFARWLSIITAPITSIFELMVQTLNNLLLSIVLIIGFMKFILVHKHYQSFIRVKQKTKELKDLLSFKTASSLNNPQHEKEQQEKRMVILTSITKARLLPMLSRLFSLIVVNKILYNNSYVDETPLLWMPKGSLEHDTQTLLNFIPNLINKLFGSNIVAVDFGMSLLNPGLIAVLSVFLILLEQKYITSSEEINKNHAQQYIFPIILLMLFNNFTPILCVCMASHSLIELTFQMCFEVISSRKSKNINLKA